MEPIDFGGALLRRWWLLLVLGLVGAMVGLLLPAGHAKHAAPSSWSSTAVVGASPAGGPGNLVVQSGDVSTDQIVFYARNVAVVTAAAKAIGRSGSISQLERAITVTGPTRKTGQLGEVRISATGPTSEGSAAFANAFANQLGTYMNGLVNQHNQYLLALVRQKVAGLETQISALGKTKGGNSLQNQLNVALAQEQTLAATAPTTGYLILQPAQASSAAKVAGGSGGLGSSRLVRGIAGLVGGLIVAAGIVLAIELLDKRLRGAARAEETFGFPVIAEIPMPSKENGDGVVSVFNGSSSSSSPMAEAYRMLKMSVLFGALVAPTRYDSGVGNGRGRDIANGHAKGAGNGHGNGSASLASTVGPRPFSPPTRQVIMVVSAGTETSRPLVVTNLAATFADGGQRVLVMSTHDLHLHAGNRVSQGSNDPRAVIAPAELEATLHTSPLANVSSIPLGLFVANSGQLALRAPAVLEAARQLADVVLVEAPPILGFHDAEALAPAVDVVLVVGECLATTFDQAKRSGELLRRIGAPVVGVALTNMRIGARDIRRSVVQPPVGPKNHLEPEQAPAADPDASPAQIKH
jgi:Mrp family chromosome partitioning ATPase